MTTPKTNALSSSSASYMTISYLKKLLFRLNYISSLDKIASEVCLGAKLMIRSVSYSTVKVDSPIVLL